MEVDPLLGLRLGLACRDLIEAFVTGAGGASGGAAERRPLLKWPNDVLMEDRKVLGVLAEQYRSKHGPMLLIGVGINANIEADDFPEELQGTAASIRVLTGEGIDLIPLRNSLVHRLAHAILQREAPAVTIDRASSVLWGLGRRVTVSMPDGTRLTGILEGISATGAARLNVDGEPIDVLSGAIDLTHMPR